jgi:hypothetical protein
MISKERRNQEYRIKNQEYRMRKEIRATERSAILYSLLMLKTGKTTNKAMALALVHEVYNPGRWHVTKVKPPSA